MDLRIVTLDHPRSVRVREPKADPGFDWYSFLVGAAAAASVLLLVGGFAVLGSTEKERPPAIEPQASTVEVPAITPDTPGTPSTAAITQTGQWDVPLTEEEMTALLEACGAANIDPVLGLSLIQVESSFRADALNERSGCYGYCQLNPRYFPSDLSPADNIRTGIKYLSEQLERYDGDAEAALTAYNAGHDTGDRTYASMVLAAATSFGG